jgi:hypothetical protein
MAVKSEAANGGGLKGQDFTGIGSGGTMGHELDLQT